LNVRQHPSKECGALELGYSWVHAGSAGLANGCKESLGGSSGGFNGKNSLDNPIVEGLELLAF
jgi:hypothetical protein